MSEAAIPAVTKIVDRIPRPGQAERLEQAIRDLIAAALEFPGHLGVTVTRPAPPVQPGFRFVSRFDSPEHLRAWEESEQYRRLVAIADRYTQGEPQRQAMTGLEAWFTLPGRIPPGPPRRARMALVTWICVFPVLWLFGSIMGRLLPPSVPSLPRVALTSALVILLVTFVVAPALTRVLGGWLYPDR